MPENNNPIPPVTEDSSVERPETEKPRKGYVKYSPLSLILLAFCAFVFSFSILGLFEQTLLDTAEGGTQEGLTQIGFPNPGDPDNPNELAPNPVPDLNKWQEIHPSLIDVSTLRFLQTPDFAALRRENSDSVAWMYWPTTADVKGLPFNLPVVQSVNNEYYLNRSFDRSRSDNGWVYADYRNNMRDLRSNRNLIFYGHARSYLIFGGLKYLNTKTSWQRDGYNHFIYINTPNERTVWQVFSWYETTVDFNYINTYFANDEEYVEFLLTLQGKNTIDAFEEMVFSPEDRVLTLSTCKGEDENVRVAVHALLVRHEWINGEPVHTDEEPSFQISDSAGSGSDSDSFEVTDPTDNPTDVPTDVPLTTGTAGGTSSSGEGPGTTDTDTPTDIPSGSGDSSGTGTPPTDTDIPTDVPSGTDVPTDVPTDTPTDVPTDPPTDVPTDSGASTPSDPATDSSGGNVTDLPSDSGSQPSVPASGGSDSGVLPPPSGGETTDTGTPAA